MYLVHLVIAVIFIIGALCCIMVDLPEELIKEEKYLIPFLKIAGGLRILIYKYRTKKNDIPQDIQKILLQLNPAGNGEKLLKNFEIKRLANALMLIFAGNMIALLICLMAYGKNPVSQGGLIGRNDYGEGDKSVRVDILSDGEVVVKNQTLTVQERQYTEEEIEQKFEEMGRELDLVILGENESLDEVRSDLQLVRQLPGYPVAIEWELTNYSVISSEGHINPEKTVEEGTLVELTAIFTYHTFRGEHRFNAVIYPPLKGQEENYAESLLSKIKDYEKRTVSYSDSILPTEMDGHEISYRAPQTQDSAAVLLGVLLLAVIIYKTPDSDLKKELKKRDEQLMVDYPQIVSKLTLLIGAGMTIQGAFMKLAADYKKKKTDMRFAYEELLITIRHIESGVFEGDAYVAFGNRCRLQKYVKLGAMLAQNLRRGSQGLLDSLEAEERDAFEDRKTRAKRAGEETGTKLLAPMGIMLLIVMIIVIMPAFMSVNM